MNRSSTSESDKSDTFIEKSLLEISMNVFLLLMFIKITVDGHGNYKLHMSELIFSKLRNILIISLVIYTLKPPPSHIINIELVIFWIWYVNLY